MGELNDCLCRYFTSFILVRRGLMVVRKRNSSDLSKTTRWPQTLKVHFSLPLDNCNRLGRGFCPTSSSLGYPGQGRLHLYSVSLWSPWMTSPLATSHFKKMGTCNFTLYSEGKPEIVDEQCWWPPQFLLFPWWISGIYTKPYFPQTYSYLIFNLHFQPHFHLASDPWVYSCQNSYCSLNISLSAFHLHDFSHTLTFFILCLTFSSFPLFPDVLRIIL